MKSNQDNPAKLPAKGDVPFYVPESYFDHLADNVMDKINHKKPVKTTVFSLVKPYLAIAASLVLIYAIWSITVSNLPINKSDKKDKAIAASEELSTISSLTFHENEIIDFLSSDVELVEETQLDSINSEEIIEYLGDTNVDYLAIVSTIEN